MWAACWLLVGLLFTFWSFKVNKKPFCVCPGLWSLCWNKPRGPWDTGGMRLFFHLIPFEHNLVKAGQVTKRETVSFVALKVPYYATFPSPMFTDNNLLLRPVDEPPRNEKTPLFTSVACSSSVLNYKFWKRAPLWCHKMNWHPSQVSDGARSRVFTLRYETASSTSCFCLHVEVLPQENVDGPTKQF